MKKILSIILTILMVASIGMFSTVGAASLSTRTFDPAGSTITAISASFCETTGEVAAGDRILLEAGQSVTFKFTSTKATKVRMWWIFGGSTIACDGTATFDLSINGTNVFTGATQMAKNANRHEVAVGNATNYLIDIVEGENTLVYTVKSGAVKGIQGLKIANTEYDVSATGTTVIPTLATTTNFQYFEYATDGQYRFYNGGVSHAERSPVYNVNVTEAGLYDVYLPANDAGDFDWTLTLDPNGTATAYTPVSVDMTASTVHKAFTVNLKAGINTFRLGWKGSAEFPFTSFSIEKAQATAVNFAGNTANLLEVPVSNAITTGTVSGGLTLAEGQSVTYKIVSDEATDVRLWWNNDVTNSSATFDLSVNGTAQMTGAALSVSASKSASIGKVSLAQGENTIVFTVKSGSISGITKLYIADAKIKLSTTERTSIHALSTSNIFTYEEHLNSAANAYISLRSSNNLVQVARMPMYYLDVEEAGAYDIYLPSQNGTLLWDVWVNEAPTGCGIASATFVNTTVATDGLHKAVTVNLNEGENYIYIAWNRDDAAKTSFANFTGFAIEKTPDPDLVTATVTGSVAEGLAVSADLSNHDGEQVMAILAVYKIKNGVKTMVTSDVDTITATTTAHSLATAAVAAEDGYTYEYKVFVWDAETLAPYPVTIN